jgi:hypothetical protein
MKRAIALAVATLVPILAAHADQPSHLSDVWKRLHAARPAVRWDMASTKAADVTCDGKDDVIAVGYRQNEMWVGVVPAARSSRPGKPMIFEFAVSAGVQEAVCSVPVEIVISRPSCLQEGEFPLPGCKIVKGCKQFTIADNRCDSLHFWWDSKRRTLGWWRA